MTKYRIKEFDYNGFKQYEIQKRFLFFNWWYNPDNIDAYTTGVYDTYEEAKRILKLKLNKKPKTRIVCEF